MLILYFLFVGIFDRAEDIVDFVFVYFCVCVVFLISVPVLVVLVLVVLIGFDQNIGLLCCLVAEHAGFEYNVFSRFEETMVVYLPRTDDVQRKQHIVVESVLQSGNSIELGWLSNLEFRCDCLCRKFALYCFVLFEFRDDGVLVDAVDDVV